jgi:hypothetical protein
MNPSPSTLQDNISTERVYLYVQLYANLIFLWGG